MTRQVITKVKNAKKQDLNFHPQAGSVERKVEEWVDINAKKQDLTLLGKLKVLKRILADLGSVLVAYSGGVDSTFLFAVAHDVLGDRALAVTARSELYTEGELKDARAFAGLIGGAYQEIETSELSVENFAENPPNRCYYCKKELFSTLQAIARDHGLAWVADGSNHDDLNDYRPGSQAAEELGVQSPLKEAGLTKEDIRHLSRTMNLPSWNKPAMACLSSRFPYGSRITVEKLQKVEQAEAFLRGLGLVQLRVRDHGDTARIEVEPRQMPSLAEPDTARAVVEKFKSLGYTYVTLDLQGYRTGSLNETLPT